MLNHPYSTALVAPLTQSANIVNNPHTTHKSPFILQFLFSLDGGVIRNKFKELRRGIKMTVSGIYAAFFSLNIEWSTV